MKNIYTVFLSVIVIILVLIFVIRYFKKKSENALNLNQSNATYPIIDTSTRYTYSVWAYINSWPSSSIAKNKNQVLFSRLSNDAMTKNIQLYFKKNVTELWIGYTSLSPPIEIKITENFPIQKWTHICVCVNESQLDVYINGKLVKSKTANLTSNFQSTDVIKLGNLENSTTNDFYLKKMKYWPKPLSSKDVWNIYLQEKDDSWWNIGNIGNIWNIFSTTTRSSIRIF